MKAKYKKYPEVWERYDRVWLAVKGNMSRALGRAVEQPDEEDQVWTGTGWQGTGDSFKRVYSRTAQRVRCAIENEVIYGRSGRHQAAQ